MQNVDADMMRIDSDNAVRRPILSPKCPQTSPPIGRMTNEMANTANVASRPVVGAASGKKTTGDNRCEIAVYGVVEPFDEVADEARRDDPPENTGRGVHRARRRCGGAEGELRFWAMPTPSAEPGVALKR